MGTRPTRRTILGGAVVVAGAALLGGWSGGTVSAAGDDTQTHGKKGAPMDARKGKQLWQSWSQLWNGNLAIADAIIAPGFVAHFAPAGASPGEVRGPDGLKQWIGGSLAAFADHSFTTTVGPLVDGDLVGHATNN